MNRDEALSTFFFCGSKKTFENAFSKPRLTLPDRSLRHVIRFAPSRATSEATAPSVILRGASLSDDAATDATAVREVRRSAPRETSRDPLARRAIVERRARANAVVVVRDPRPLDVRI
jgi:hypothetical protein